MKIANIRNERVYITVDPTDIRKGSKEIVQLQAIEFENLDKMDNCNKMNKW